MKFSILAVVAASTLAAATRERRHQAHGAFHLRRNAMPCPDAGGCDGAPVPDYSPPATETPNVCGVCTTTIIYSTGEATLVPYTAPPPPPPPPTTTTPPPPPPSSTPPPPPPTTSAAPSKAVFAAPVPSPSAPVSPKVGGSGKQWAMTYSPYSNDRGCKGYSEIVADVKKIASLGFKTVRFYSTDCKGLQAGAEAARASGLKLIVGIFIDSKGIEASKSQVQDLISWGQWDLVELVVVGNECIFNGFCNAGALASYITYVKGALTAYKGPITTTEPLGTLQGAAGALCAAIDVVAANIHPFFNAGISADQAGEFAASQLKLVGQCCPGKEAFNLETGWPHTGGANGAAVPGIAQQKAAVFAIMNQIGGKSAFFSFVDDGWKDPGNLGVEQNFGCSQLF